MRTEGVMIEFGSKPGDSRGFLHKKILGLAGTVAGFIPGVGEALGVAKGIKGFIGGGKARPTEEKNLGRQLKFGNGNGARRCPPGQVWRAGAGYVDGCYPITSTVGTTKGPGGADGCIVPGMRRDQYGKCRFYLGERSGPNGGAPMGDAVMGMHGAGMQPGIASIERAVCGKKMVLGDDGICYHKTQISNKERMWPRGRRPLITGGEMNAATIAARVGARLDRTASKLREKGLMKPLPKPRQAKAPAHHHHPAAS